MKPRLRVTLLSLCMAIMLAGCCTKKFCLGQTYETVYLIFQGYTPNQLDSVYLQEYDKNSGQLVQSLSAIRGEFALGPQYAYKDSFFLNQRYFGITSPWRNDTLNNITYQQGTKTINCNNCPGDRDVIYTLANFSFNYKGVTYNNGRDSVFVIK